MEERGNSNRSTIKVLDKGFVSLVDFMGSDQAIVQAARVSYGQGTKSAREDRGLISYLVRHAHTSPLEMVEFKFHMKMPLFVARQIIRHRTAGVNELSARYSVLKDEFYVPDMDRLQKQNQDNKQGSALELVDNPEQVYTNIQQQQTQSYTDYEELLGTGMARELARINLPVSVYTEWYWKMDLHNLFHFLRLRLDKHAQWEVRQYAEAVYQLIQPIVPWACEAFEEYILHGQKLSRLEWEFVRSFLPVELDGEGFAAAAAEHFGDHKSELREFMNKL